MTTTTATTAGRPRARAGLWGALLVTVLVVLLALAVASGGGSAGDGDLSPDGRGPNGSAALVAVLRDHGVRVDAVQVAADLPADPSTTTVVTQASGLDAAVLDRLRTGNGPLVLVAPDDDTLAKLAPGVTEAGIGGRGRVHDVEPDCSDDDARAAGAITLDGGDLGPPTAYDTDDDSQETRSCYGVPQADDPGDDDQQALGSPTASPVTVAAVGRSTPSLLGAGNGPSAAILVRTKAGGRDVDVLGAPELLTNDLLDDSGNAALALRLIGRTARVAWYTPLPEDTDLGSGGSLFGLLPAAVRWGTLQLVIALVVALLWWGRRSGRLVTEPLPVIVRAAETEEGRARLYVRAGARGRSAAILRTAALRRLARRFDVAPTADTGLVVTLVAAQTGRAPAEVASLLLGSEPVDDKALVLLAHELDALERAVGGRPG